MSLYASAKKCVRDNTTRSTIIYYTYIWYSWYRKCNNNDDGIWFARRPWTNHTRSAIYDRNRIRHLADWFTNVNVYRAVSPDVRLARPIASYNPCDWFTTSVNAAVRFIIRGVRLKRERRSPGFRTVNYAFKYITTFQSQKSDILYGSTSHGWLRRGHHVDPAGGPDRPRWYFCTLFLSTAHIFDKSCCGRDAGKTTYIIYTTQTRDDFHPVYDYFEPYRRKRPRIRGTVAGDGPREIYYPIVRGTSAALYK